MEGYSSTSPAGVHRSSSRKRLPSMYQQFLELADVDITKEPMEIGPTCHYVMGGVEVDADSQATMVPGLLPPAKWRGACMGPTVWAAIRFPISSCSVRERGSTPPRTPKNWAARPKVVQADLVHGLAEVARTVPGPGWRREPIHDPPGSAGGHAGSRGIIRVEDELKEALEKVAVLR